jgi:hypothetical protein
MILLALQEERCIFAYLLLFASAQLAHSQRQRHVSVTAFSRLVSEFLTIWNQVSQHYAGLSRVKAGLLGGRAARGAHQLFSSQGVRRTYARGAMCRDERGAQSRRAQNQDSDADHCRVGGFHTVELRFDQAT